MILLRDYQTEVLDRVRTSYRAGNRRVLMVLPTGAGKTVCFSSIAESAARRDSRILILAHRFELIDQIRLSLEQFEVHPDMVSPHFERRDSNVCVASVPSLVRRLDLEREPNLIICDEAHHVARSSHATGANSWGRIFLNWPRARHLGVTATPVRLDGRGLGEFFDDLIVGPQVPDLIALGHLSPLRIFAPATVDTSELHVRGGEFNSEQSEALINRRAITGSALDHYRKHCDGKRALIFTISVAHAAAVAQQFREAGYSSVHLSGETSPGIRRSVVADFQGARLQILTSCDLFSEGFDCPGAEVGIMLRPTMSLGMYRQQVGRILRPAPGKTAVLLDHVGNTSMHGLPDEPIEWALEMDGKTRKKSSGVKLCPNCWAAIKQAARRCPNCDHIFGAGGDPREIEECAGDLQELTPETRAARKARSEHGRLRTLEELKEFGRLKGYAPGWAMHIWKARVAKGQAQ